MPVTRQRRKRRSAPVEQLYSPEEACVLLGIGRTRLYELMEAGDISPTYKLSHKCRRIPAGAISRYLEARQL